METETVGHVALLPDGQRVKIEIVHDDGYVTARRLDGEWSGEIAVCEVSKLLPRPGQPRPQNYVLSKLKCPVFIASEMSDLVFLIN